MTSDHRSRASLSPTRRRLIRRGVAGRRGGRIAALAPVAALALLAALILVAGLPAGPAHGQVTPPDAGHETTAEEIPWVRGGIRLPAGDAIVRLQLLPPDRLSRLEPGSSRLIDTLDLEEEFWHNTYDLSLELRTPKDIYVGGRDLAAGTYAFYAVPGDEEWTFHLIPTRDLLGLPEEDPETGRLVQRFVPSDSARTFTAPAEEVDVRTGTRILGERREGGSDLLLRAQPQRAEVRIPFDG